MWINDDIDALRRPDEPNRQVAAYARPETTRRITAAHKDLRHASLRCEIQDRSHNVTVDQCEYFSPECAGVLQILLESLAAFFGDRLVPAMQNEELALKSIGVAASAVEHLGSV
jgi:hypothetical protein